MLQTTPYPRKLFQLLCATEINACEAVYCVLPYVAEKRRNGTKCEESKDERKRIWEREGMPVMRLSLDWASLKISITSGPGFHLTQIVG